jgi:uncharacterized protein
MTEHELELTRLFVYPIKSVRGIELTEAQVLERGLEHDRRFMLVDGGGNLVTSRQHPKLLTVSTALSGENLIVNAPGMPELRLPLEVQGEERRVRVWFDWMPGLVVGDGASGWFSEFLRVPVRLVWMPEHSERRMNPEFGPSRLSFADGNPFHLVSESSIADLEDRVGAAVGVERFRPNLVVRGAQAYAEDRWTRVTFGSLEFKVHEPCARCMVVNLEPTTGQIGVEPLRTLARYRRQGKSVLFGQHLHTSGRGLLRVGQHGMVMDKT